MTDKQRAEEFRKLAFDIMTHEKEGLAVSFDAETGLAFFTANAPREIILAFLQHVMDGYQAGKYDPPEDEL